MSNELLGVLKAPKNREYDIIDSYLQNISIEDFKEQIKALLALQRQECAEKAAIKVSDREICVKQFDVKDDDGEYSLTVNKQSILNATIL